ncbi:glycoside hydrolase family 108 protein [Lelliottia sp. CFBP8978]|jgi:typhoid toxin secretion A|uniref:glycoside hydrolase family 108 protein n=1 Tax=Lelliottia sp. CFBP8978 TaxID=3096522 RepID=UPI002A6B0CFC|nr:glycosyl hydrolase 108 family protein [Lelliottia sp. CFBP8978]MDY1038723.1 glycosyl hydrolase 108 family protein [Lelliottia sp. CFBP8978]
MSKNPVIEEILKNEGGYVNHPDDVGGPTHWGITEKTARSYGYTGDMKDFTRENAYTILEKNYWYQPGFDKVNQLSPDLAMELCDTGTNMGPSVGIKWLQRWLNAYNRKGADYSDIDIDGKIGPATLNTLATFLKIRGKEGEAVMLTSLNCSQGQRYLELAEGKQGNESFIYGWMRARVHID